MVISRSRLQLRLCQTLPSKISRYRGRAREFRQVTDATLLFQTKQYLLIPSIQFLCLLDTNFSSDQAQPYIKVKSDMDMERFKALKDGKNELIYALKLSRKRASHGSGV